MDKTLVLKAIADETRMKILSLLLRHNYCVRALARKLELSEGAISQHLKVLRDAGLLTGEKKGYFMHYDVNREVLHALAADIEELASVEREACTPEEGGCHSSEQERCHVQKQNCSEEVKESCHGKDFAKGEGSHEHHGHCNCHRSE
ncbi:helix-turn-helix transcriptional regulator [uncultured Oscillibacter sp.]|uniref:ArsR/SmtB family transcription factor n=1 Tax=uncultured Oscillibacter sp. TaxID=876091 RepID=UPI0025DF3378|nr:metalloregulator ArsR/SmtB family transcription factor [uncultured Oscillibacter sp.]